MMFVVFAAEYKRRVKSKVFLIVTFLGPLLLFGGVGTMAFLAMQSAEIGDRAPAWLPDRRVGRGRPRLRRHEG